MHRTQSPKYKTGDLSREREHDLQARLEDVILKERELMEHRPSRETVCGANATIWGGTVEGEPERSREINACVKGEEALSASNSVRMITFQIEMN